MLQNPDILLTFDKIHNFFAPATRNDILTSKSGPNPWCFLHIFTSKCASRHNRVHFIDIATSKSGPRMVCFVHFDLETCFVPQPRALFRHLNFQKWCVLYILTSTCASRHRGVQWSISHLASCSAPAALVSLLFDPRGHISLEKHSVSRLSF